MDGRSLSRLLHKRGVNVRYLGMLHELASKTGSRLHALKEITEREMVSRAFKHIANRYLRDLPATLTAHCVAHLLNCLLGSKFNSNPTPFLEDVMTAYYSKSELEYVTVTPDSLQREVASQVFSRFRHDLDAEWLSRAKPLQLLREIALKLGLQLEAREYSFHKKDVPVEERNGHAVNGTSTSTTNGHSASNGKKKHRAADNQNQSPAQSDQIRLTHTFVPEDIINVVPIVKETSPKVRTQDDVELGTYSRDIEHSCRGDL